MSLLCGGPKSGRPLVSRNQMGIGAPREKASRLASGRATLEARLGRSSGESNFIKRPNSLACRVSGARRLHGQINQTDPCARLIYIWPGRTFGPRQPLKLACRQAALERPSSHSTRRAGWGGGRCAPSAQLCIRAPEAP